MKGEYSYFVVALVDVLGQKDAFAGMPEFPSTEEDRIKLTEIHHQTAGFLEDLRSFITRTFEKLASGTGVVDTLPEPQKSEFIRLRQTTVKINSFSDTIVAFANISGDSKSTTGINSIYAIIATLTGALLRSLEKKHVIRGAIDIGLATEHFDGEVYGPGLIRAYVGEKDHARYPRIVIGNELMKYLGAATREPENTIEGRVHRMLAARSLELITKDAANQHFLDFLGAGVRDLAKETPIQKLVPKISDFVKSELQRFKDCGNAELVARYELLDAYVESRKALWIATGEVRK